VHAGTGIAGGRSTEHAGIVLPQQRRGGCVCPFQARRGDDDSRIGVRRENHFPRAVRGLLETVRLADERRRKSRHELDEIDLPAGLSGNIR